MKLTIRLLSATLALWLVVAFCTSVLAYAVCFPLSFLRDPDRFADTDGLLRKALQLLRGDNLKAVTQFARTPDELLREHAEHLRQTRH